MDERMDVQPWFNQESSKRYRFYRTGYIEAISRESRTKKSKCDPTRVGAYWGFEPHEKRMAYSHCNLNVKFGLLQRKEQIYQSGSDGSSIQSRSRMKRSSGRYSNNPVR